MKHIFIVNKISGKGISYRLVGTIKQVCEERNLDYEIKVTEYPGHTTEIAKEIKPGDVTVYSVGGDGTLLDIVNGLDPSIPLGIIPGGSGNDFYRYFGGVCKDLKENLIKTIDANPRVIDIAKSDRMTFLNCTSLGTDAKINYDASKLIRKTFITKGPAYILSIIKNIILIHANNYKITVDDKDYSGRYYVIACMNGRFYGNGVESSPLSKVDDGMLDLVLFKKCPRIKAYLLLGKYLKGKHVGDPNIIFVKGKKITIDGDVNEPCQSDGENYESNHIDIEILENYLTIKVAS